MSNVQDSNNSDLLINSIADESKTRDYTHRSPPEIKRRLNLGKIETFLLWLAKADLYVLLISTYESRGRLMSLGAMVVFTALLAFCTSFYTLTTTLIGPDSSYRIIAGLFLASIYTFGIVIIDREIVGATSKSVLSSFVRLVFAVFIAVAVSYPAKLKFFEGRITQEINQMITENNVENYDRIAVLKDSAMLERQERIANIQSRIESSNKEIAVFDKQISEEQDRGFCGPKCLDYISQKEAKVAALLLTEQQLALESEKPVLSETSSVEVASLEEAINNQRSRAYDILYKNAALNRITAADPSANLISWFLMIFFLILELVPLALKWSMGFTEYHYYMEARNRINKQKIVSITNIYMEMMQADPKNVFRVPLELTDLIALMLEDESRHIEQPENMVQTLNDLWQASIDENNNTEAPPNGGTENSAGESRSGAHRNTDPETTPQ